MWAQYVVSIVFAQALTDIFSLLQVIIVLLLGGKIALLLVEAAKTRCHHDQTLMRNEYVGDSLALLIYKYRNASLTSPQPSGGFALLFCSPSRKASLP